MGQSPSLENPSNGTKRRSEDRSRDRSDAVESCFLRGADPGDIDRLYGWVEGDVRAYCGVGGDHGADCAGGEVEEY